MNRIFVYSGQIPIETDVLNTNKNSYIALSKLTDALLGKTQILNNFACTATAPASLTVNIGFGEIYSLQYVDPTAYGSLAADSVNQIIKQGVILSTTNLSCPAPSTIGNSINYLIEIGFLETDTNSTVLSYYNAANINQPLSGPGGSGTAQNTLRQDSVSILVKAGTSAATGTQTTPSPDTGYTGAYVVSVAYGQTSITSSNISVYSGNSFIGETLTQKISQPTADLRYAQFARVQSNYYNFTTDTGSVNAYAGSLSPAITSYTQGLPVHILISNTNTGAATLNLNALGVKNIKSPTGNTLNPGDLSAGMLAILEFDGTNFQLLNAGSSVYKSLVQLNSFNYSTDTGTANAYIATLTPAPAAYSAGLSVILNAANSNTGASTINVNGLGNKNILNLDGTPLAANAINAGKLCKLIYDGTNFELVTNNTLQGVSSANPIVRDATDATKILNIDVSSLSTGTARTLAMPNNYVNLTSCAFYAYMSIPQTIPTNAVTKIAFNAKLYDVNNCFDSTVNYRFTAPIAGFYAFWGIFSGNYNSGGTNSNIAAALFKNGASYSSGTAIPSFVNSSFSITTNIYSIISLAVGDYIEFWVATNSTGPVTTSAVASQIQYFCGHKLP